MTMKKTKMMTMMRIFYRLRIACKTWWAKHHLVIEFCHDCGRKQPLDWYAEDALWRSVTKQSSGVFCPECFDARARKLGLMLRWRPVLWHGE